MLLRAVGTGFGSGNRGDAGYSLASSAQFELGRAQDTQVSCAYFPKQDSYKCFIGNANVALVVDEAACIVHRRFRGDAATSPSPIGRISERKPDWDSKRHFDYWDNYYHYDEWIVTPMRYRGWMLVGGSVPAWRVQEIREAMSQFGLPEMTKRIGHQR